MTLTRPMRDTLEHAVRQELRRVHDDQPGRPAWPAHPSTLAALVRHGLMARSQRKSNRGYKLDIWTITIAGRDALEPIKRFRRDHPVYLAPVGNGHSDYTTDPRRRVDDAEVTDPASLQSAWRQQAEQRKADAEDRRKLAQRLARSARRAA